MSIETLTSAPTEQVEKSEAKVSTRYEGKLKIMSIDGFSATPKIDSFMKRSGDTALHGNFERGLTVFDAPDKGLSYRKSPDYSLRNARRAEATLAKQLDDAPGVTALAFTREDVTFYQPVDSKHTLVAMGEDDRGVVSAQILQSDPETSIGHYVPRGGDRLYLLPGTSGDEDVTGYFLRHPGSEKDIVDTLNVAEHPYAMFTVSEDQAEAMAKARRQAAAGKASVDRRRIEADNAGKARGQTGDAEQTAFKDVHELADGAEPKSGAIDSMNGDADSTPDEQVGAEAATSTVAEESTPEDAVAADAPESSESSKALDRMRAAHSAESPAATTVEPPVAAERFDKSARYKAALGEYRTADEKLARGMAVRTKLGIFARRKTRERLDEENHTVAEAYFAQSDLFEALQVEKWKANKPDITDDEITAKLAAYHTAKQRLHAMRTQEEFRTIKKHGKLSEWNDSVLEKYAGLTKKQKIAVGIGAAAAIGAVGFVAGGLGVIGAAGVMGAKVYKTYAQNRAGLYAPTHQIDTMTTRGEDESGNMSLKTNDALRAEAREVMERRQRARTAEVDTINKKTKVAVLASTALIGAGLVTSHLNEIQDAGRMIGDRAREFFGGHDVANPVVTAPADAHIEFPRTEITVIPGADHAEAPVAPNVPEFSADALRVDAGEGWYQTFNEIGVTNATEQANLLQKVGPELVRRGVAYQMADGSYGMSRPGTLSKDVLELIQKSR